MSSNPIVCRAGNSMIDALSQVRHCFDIEALEPVHYVCHFDLLDQR